MRLLIFLSFISLHTFSQNIEGCLKRDFSSKITNSDFMWGLVNYELNISKKRCVITLFQDKVLKSEWKIDICREPIHIKAMQYFTNKEYIKEMECNTKSKNTFCKKTAELSRLLQKEALIHAKGEREDLSSEHGQVYCLYKLINEYLLHDEIFSMNKSYENAQFHGVSFGAKTTKRMTNTFVEPTLTTTTSTTQSVYITEDEIKEGTDPIDPSFNEVREDEEVKVQVVEPTPTLKDVEQEVIEKVNAENKVNPEEAFNKGVSDPANPELEKHIESNEEIKVLPAVEQLDSF